MGRDADREDAESGFQFPESGDADAGPTSDDAGDSEPTDNSGFQFVDDADPGTEGVVERAPSLDATQAREGAADAESHSGPVAGAAVGEPIPVDPPELVDPADPDHHRSTPDESDTCTDHEAHHPVVEDWPRGVGEASWWPIVTALGAAAIYASVALWLLGRGRGSVVGSAAGPVAFLGALGVTLFGVYGWLYHSFVAHFWTRGTNRLTARSLRWAMLGFIASEIVTFGTLVAYYLYVRAGPWPPAGMAGGIDLFNVLVVANTVVLLLSSLTLHFAHHALANDNRDRFRRLLGLTIGLGLLFLAGQAVEYHQFINREGFTWTSGVFGSAFFGLTGLHGAHVAFGVLLLTITLVRGRHGQFDAERDLSVSLVSLYWHFIDAVWLFLVAVVYVGASVSP